MSATMLELMLTLIRPPLVADSELTINTEPWTRDYHDFSEYVSLSCQRHRPVSGARNQEDVYSFKRRLRWLSDSHLHVERVQK